MKGSNAEELVLQVQQGKKQAFEQYVFENEKFIYDIIHKTLHPETQRIHGKAEIFNIAIFHLYKAMMRFDFQKGTLFSTYAFPYIRYGLLSDLGIRVRDTKKQIKTISLDYQGENEKGEKTYIEICTPMHTKGDEHTLIIELEEILSDLGQSDQLIFYLHFFEGLKQAEIGEIVGKNQVYVSRRLTKIKEYIKPFYD